MGKNSEPEFGLFSCFSLRGTLNLMVLQMSRNASKTEFYKDQSWTHRDPEHFFLIVPLKNRTI